MQSNPKHFFLYIASYLSFLATLILAFGFSNPVIDLDQMHKESFSIVDMHWPARSTCGAHIRVKSLVDGQIKTFYSYLSEPELDILERHTNEQVTFWIQDTHELFRWNCPTIQQMEFHGNVIRPYASFKYRLLAAERRRPYEFGLCLAIWLLPWLYFFLRFRRDEKNDGEKFI